MTELELVQQLHPEGWVWWLCVGLSDSLVWVIGGAVVLCRVAAAATKTEPLGAALVGLFAAGHGGRAAQMGDWTGAAF